MEANMKTHIAKLYERDRETLACRPEDIKYAAAVIEYALTADPRLEEFRTHWAQVLDELDTADECPEFDQAVMCAFTSEEMEAYCNALHIHFAYVDGQWLHTIRCVASMKSSSYFFGWTNHSPPFEHKDECVLDAFLTYVIKDN